MESNLRQIIRQIIKESFDKESIIDQYIKQSQYDISKGLGNCAFFAKDFSDWWYGRNGYPKIQRNGNCEILYMPQDEDFADNSIQNGEVEDHIVAMVDNTIIDFVYTPGKGVSHKISRNPSNQLNPQFFDFDNSLFEENGEYGKYGYRDKDSKSWSNGNKVSTSMPDFISSFKFPPLKKLNESDPKVGTGKKPKNSGRRLYTDENPKDTVSVKFRTKEDIADTLNKASFKSKSHKRQSQIINLIHQRVRAAYQNAKDPETKSRLKRAFDYIESRKEQSKKKTENLRKLNENNVPQSGESSGAPAKFKEGSEPEKIEYFNLDQILSQIKGIPYYKEVLEDMEKGDESWSVTKKVKEYAEYMKKNPSSLEGLPPIIVINNVIQDGAHRISAIYLLKNLLDSKNDFWSNVKLKVEFWNSKDQLKDLNESYQDELLDDILDKVAKYGEKSLLPHEKSVLDRISSGALEIQSDEDLVYDFLDFDLGELKSKSYAVDKLGKKVYGIQYFDKNNEFVFDLEVESEVLGIKKENNYLYADDTLFRLIKMNFTMSDKDIKEVVKRWFEKTTGEKVSKIDFWVSGT